mgnify:CR=1 FL=1
MIGYKQIESDKLPAAATVTCPRCSHAIPVVTHAQAINIGCPGCSYLLQQYNGHWTGFKNLNQHRQIPAITIGAKARLREVMYQVTGFIVYVEARAPYRWREYVLFNPIYGYAFLSEYDGHWIFFRYMADMPLKETHASSIHYEQDEYKLFHRYSSKVVYATGEFNWKLLESVSRYAEYIAPPKMLVQELGTDETCWLQGEHIEPHELNDAFDVVLALPERIGIGALEPFDKNFSFKKVASIGGVACGILLVLQLLFMLFNSSRLVADNVYGVAPPLDEFGLPTLPAIPGPTFELSSLTGTSSLEIELEAPIYNSWFSLGITLINTTTNKAYDLELGTEYYEGYTGGEHWREGSTNNDVVLSALPDGTYNMILQPYKDRLSNTESFRLKVRRDVPLWSNFWIILLLLALFPVIQWIRYYSHEKSRWMNSDYSTYNYN